ncbi:hypothetical protein BT63DRAFT_478867 [Microthyrium microscopicum]|uniref:DUF1687-domain-containing protein n=1 Tax=Microthyrium microscopicum TaxID=703497 RepID=A0A6A6UC85_9PEZI|nr:hypothetical protein BT63DRAFT_478867 [Microthyrium microscopicum]
MWKKLFGEAGAKNAVTLFSKPNHQASASVAQFLRSANVVKEAGAKKDDSGSKFELTVSEEPPTSDQLRSILEFVGESNASKVVEGADNVEDAQRKVRLNADTLKRPLTVDWNAGKVTIGDSQSELKSMLKE